MEPHSEQRGGLRDKFEGFEFQPNDAVWDRIAETPTDRPLGAKFRAFTWEPHPRVWRGIVAALNPAARRRVWVWSAAAGVALVAGLTWMLSGSPDAQPAMHLAGSNWQSKTGMGGDLVAVHHARSTGHGTHNGSLNLADASATGPAGGPDAHGPSDASPYRQPNGHQRTGIASGTRPDRGFRDPKPGSDRQPSKTILPRNKANGGEIEKAAFASQDRMESRRLSSLSLNMLEVQRGVILRQALNAEMERMNDPKWAVLPKEKEEEAASAEANLYAQAGSSVGAPGPRSMEANAFEDYVGIDSMGIAAIPNSVNESRDDFEEIYAQNYLPPVSVGFAVDHSLGKRFGLSAGLVYTRMRSYMEFSGNGGEGRVDLTRHYLGLNLGGTYNLPLGKRLGAYATAGLRGDLGLGKQLVSSAAAVGFAATTERGKGAAGNYLSGNLGLGMRFAIVPRVSLYFQGTASNYFLYSQRNLWTSRPVWPSGQVGVRISL